uniref:malate:quinone oxidoreductase n=1 Tax=Aquiluna sp. TaxID=2053504 RepID=UPI00404827FA
VAIKNLDLVTYLLREVTKSRKKKLESLREFVPSAKEEDWTYYEAGQRAQVIKPAKGGGVLQFGTEVISSKDGTIAGLLGASPGASVSVSVMLDVMERMFPASFASYLPTLKEMIPGYGQHLNAKPALAKKTLAASAKVLKLKA